MKLSRVASSSLMRAFTCSAELRNRFSSLNLNAPCNALIGAVFHVGLKLAVMKKQSSDLSDPVSKE
jgi:hypothetical protein